MKDNTKKVVEYDLDLERAVMAALLLERDCRIQALSMFPKNPRVFGDATLAQVYSAVLELDAEELQIDALTVANKLKEYLVMPENKVLPYIMDLFFAANGFEHFGTHCMCLLDMYVRREAKAAKDEYQAALNANMDVVTAMQTLDKRNAEIAEVYAKRRMVFTAKDTLLTILQKSQDASKNPDTVTGIDTGLEKLNYSTAGWQKGHLNIIGARPAMGKTMLMNHFAIHAVKKGKRVLVFSIEMPKEDIVRRMLASEAQVSAMEIKSGRADFKALADASASLELQNTDKLFVDDTAGISIFEIEAKINLVKPDIVLIDYLQIISVADNARRREGIEDNSRALKVIAKKYSIPIVVLAQLSRDVEKRGSKIPVMSDLREAGGIEQDGDVIAMLHRPAYYSEGDSEDVEKYPNELQLIITKNRDGEVGTIYLQADLRTQTVTDLHPDYYSRVNYVRPEIVGKQSNSMQMPNIDHFTNSPY
jgi:replicative DNA helicase